MNYSDYFENKVAATLSNQFNLVILKTKAGTDLEFLSETKLFSTMSQVWSVINELDPYAIIFEDNIITIKVMDYGKEKVQ